MIGREAERIWDKWVEDQGIVVHKTGVEGLEYVNVYAGYKEIVWDGRGEFEHVLVNFDDVGRVMALTGALEKWLAGRKTLILYGGPYVIEWLNEDGWKCSQIYVRVYACC